MPIYDYRCTNCGHVVEVVHGVHESGPTVCPECGGLLRKRMSAPAIHFRGTGWAKKDARSASDARTARGKADSAEKAAGAGAGASEGSSATADGGAASEAGGKPSNTGGTQAGTSTGSRASGDD